MPTAHVVVIPGAHHYVYLSNEADVLREMYAFYLPAWISNSELKGKGKPRTYRTGPRYESVAMRFISSSSVLTCSREGASE